MVSLYSRLLPGRSETAVRADATESTAPGDVSVGRIIRKVDERRVAQSSAALAEMMFGRQLRRLPADWRGAAAYGVVTPALRQACSPQTLVQLAPGWAHAVAQQLDARFFVVEVRALETGVWGGALDPGGEHLFDELLALVAQAQSARVTPVLIDNGISAPGSPGSFTLRSTVHRLRAAVPARLEPEGNDRFASAPSDILTALMTYARGE